MPAYANVPTYALRGCQFVFAVASLGLMSRVMHRASPAGNPAVIGFSTFTAAFSLIACLYGIVAIVLDRLWSSLPSWLPLSVLIWDGSALLFSFAASIALAAKLGMAKCGNDDYLNSSIFKEAPNMGDRCRSSQAGDVFLFFTLITFIGTLFFSFRARRHHRPVMPTSSMVSTSAV